MGGEGPAAPNPAGGRLNVLDFRAVGVERGGRPILEGIDWSVDSEQRWVVLGPNGGGKTTLLRMAAAELRPTNGMARVLGERLGAVDMRILRDQIALVSGSVLRSLRASLTVGEAVLGGCHAALETWWHRYTEADRQRAAKLLEALGVDSLAATELGVISEGERAQVLMARALMGQPQLLLLDEPAAGLDLGAREKLLSRLHHLCTDAGTPPLVLVTHHVEEIPAGITHAGLLAGGAWITTGPLEEVLTGESLSACFGVAISVGTSEGRWWARARGATGGSERGSAGGRRPVSPEPVDRAGRGGGARLP